MHAYQLSSSYILSRRVYLLYFTLLSTRYDRAKRITRSQSAGEYYAH